MQMYKNMKTAHEGASRPLPTFNPFRILAFQRIFFDFYRNTDYTTNDPEAYNIDNRSGGTSIDYYQAVKMFEPRYSLWHKDRITSVKPSPCLLCKILILLVLNLAKVL